jgi:prefoldin beta subunit
MDKDKRIQELSILQQNVANISAQKQQFTTQLKDFNSAFKALEKTNSSYKIIGNIMIAADKEDLKKDIKEKSEIISAKVKILEKQEIKLQEKAATMQKEIMSNLSE